jgi:hypothetical protein
VRVDRPSNLARPARRGAANRPTRDSTIVDLQVRDAKFTDIDRIMTLIEHARPNLTLDELDDAAELLRQMIYLPNASVTVALDGRTIVAMAVLSIRPSVAASGLVAAVDLFFVEPGWSDSATDALLAELVRSARNKGCTLIEARLPDDEADLKRWHDQGFAAADQYLVRFLKQPRANARPAAGSAKAGPPIKN